MGLPIPILAVKIYINSEQISNDVSLKFRQFYFVKFKKKITKLKMNQDEIKNAVNVIQEFIHLIVNGIEVVRDDDGISSVRIVDHQSKKLIR